jgi:hypothetical protein
MLNFPANPGSGQIFKAQNGIVYTWDGVKWTSIGIDGDEGKPPCNIEVGPNPPKNPSDNQLWLNTVNGRLYFYYNDGDSKQWLDISFGVSGGGTGVYVDISPPANPSNGDLWFNTQKGELAVYYNDGNSQQWVNISFGASAGGSQVTTGSTPPTSANEGDLWFNTVNGRFYVWFNDGNSKQWTDITGN